MIGTALHFFVGKYMAVKKLIAGLSVAFCGVLSSGCLVPYAYPSLSCTPAVSTGPQPAEVRAFRVDVTADVVDMGETDHFLLAEVSPWSTGHIPPQARVSLDYGVFVFGVALNYSIHRGHSTLVRLYRPGHPLVEVKPWDLPASVTWTEVADLAAQEQAVDSLLRAARIGWRGHLMDRRWDSVRREKEPWHLDELPPGSASRAHRQALLFAAAEYDRIAMVPAPADEASQRVRERVAAKARWLRELAEK